MSENEQINDMLDAMSDDDGHAVASAEVGRMLLRAEQSHVKKQDQLRAIVQHCKNGGVLKFGEDGPQIESDTAQMSGAIIGIEIALHIFGDFPIKFSDPNEDD